MDFPDKKPVQDYAQAWKPRSDYNNKKPHDKSEIACYKCQKKGYYARECPSQKEKPKETLCKPWVEVAWSICEYHNAKHKHGMNFWETKMHNKGIYEDEGSESDSSMSNNAKDDMEIICVGKCTECNTNKKIRKETQTFNLDDVEYEENHFDNNNMIFSEFSDTMQ
jgi:hypothetical protein